MRKLIALSIGATILAGCSPEMLKSVLANLKDGKTTTTQPTPSGAPPSSLAQPLPPHQIAPGEPNPGSACAHAVLAVRWGKIPAVVGEFAEVSWGGHIKVENGHVRLLKKLAFEDNDHILDTHVPDLLEWKTLTFGANDGVLAVIIAAPDAPEPIVTIQNDRLGDVQFKFHELGGLYKYYADLDGQQMELRGHVLPPRPDQCRDFGAEIPESFEAIEEEDLTVEQNEVVDDIEEDFEESDPATEPSPEPSAEASTEPSAEPSADATENASS